MQGIDTSPDTKNIWSTRTAFEVTCHRADAEVRDWGFGIWQEDRHWHLCWRCLRSHSFLKFFREMVESWGSWCTTFRSSQLGLPNFKLNDAQLRGGWADFFAPTWTSWFVRLVCRMDTMRNNRLGLRPTQVRRRSAVSLTHSLPRRLEIVSLIWKGKTLRKKWFQLIQPTPFVML